MQISEITTKHISDYLRLIYDDIDESELTFLQSLIEISKAYILSYTGLTMEYINAHKEFVIVIYVLVEDMYDNRTLYVDSTNMNKTVMTILNMHSVNLL